MKYNGLQAIYMSFFSKDLYRDVVENWKGICFQYLFVWTLFISVVVSVVFHFFVVVPVTQVLIGQSDSLPNMTFKNYELSIDKESPYELKDQYGNVGIVFDTSDNPADLPAGKPGMIVKKKSVVYQTQYKSTETPYQELSPGLENMTITREQVKDFLQRLKQWLSPAIFSVMVPSAFIFLALQAVIYAAIGMIFSNIAKANLTYGELMRLAVIGLTPVLVLDTILKITRLDFPVWPFLAIIIALAYLFFGVKANSERAAPPATETPPTAAV